MEKQNDNLSEKLTASELIRANRRAEAAESERLKAQSLHYKEEINVLRDQADRNMEAIAGLHSKLDTVSDKTHDTGVRIYRNVQAVIVEEQRRQTDEILSHMQMLSDQVDLLKRKVEESSKDKTGVLSIVLLIALIANLILTMLMFCGITF